MGDDRCICSDVECAIRAWANGNMSIPMNAIQRNYCLNEIDSVEGYSRKEYETATDRQVANAVLSAWVDYCRDKGLL